jgi:hypothetical protein
MPRKFDVCILRDIDTYILTNPRFISPKQGKNVPQQILFSKGFFILKNLDKKTTST